jgi:RNA polymerase sigma-70 factor (ECF subfamily)
VELVDVTDDDDLWRRIQTGDEAAFTCLYRRHVDAIYNYCFRRLGNWSAAEDTAASVFLEAWRRTDAEVRPGKVLPWLYGIATNAVRNRRRSDRRRVAALRRVPVEVPTPDLAEDAISRADDERQMKTILARVSALSKHEQDVLALCVWSELSYEDAASALGIPVGTVRSRLARTRARLRVMGPGAEPNDHDPEPLGGGRTHDH